MRDANLSTSRLKTRFRLIDKRRIKFTLWTTRTSTGTTKSEGKKSKFNFGILVLYVWKYGLWFQVSMAKPINVMQTVIFFYRANQLLNLYKKIVFFFNDEDVRRMMSILPVAKENNVNYLLPRVHLKRVIIGRLSCKPAVLYYSVRREMDFFFFLVFLQTTF